MAESEKNQGNVSPGGTEYHSPVSSHEDLGMEGWEEERTNADQETERLQGARPKDLPTEPPPGSMTEVQFQQRNVGIGGPSSHLRDFAGGVETQRLGHWPPVRNIPPPAGVMPHTYGSMWDAPGQQGQNVNVNGHPPWVMTSTPMGVPGQYPVVPGQYPMVPSEQNVTIGRQVVTDLTRMVERLTTLLADPRRVGVNSVESLCDRRNRARDDQARGREEPSTGTMADEPQAYVLGSPTEEPPVRGSSRRDTAAPADRMRALGKKYQEPDKFLGEFGTWDVFRDDWQRVCCWNEWTEEVARESLLIHVKGSAKSFLMTVPDLARKTHQEILGILEERYGFRRTYDEERRLLERRRKAPQETFHKLQQDILNMTSRVYRDANDAYRTRAARDHFIKALPKNIQPFVAASRPDSIQEAVEAASATCLVLDPDQLGNLHQEEQPTRRVRLTDSYPVEESEDDALEDTVTLRVRMEDMVCRRCGKKGHFARMCSQPATCYNCEEQGHIKPDCPYELRPLDSRNRPTGPLVRKGERNTSKMSGNEVRSQPMVRAGIDRN